jgi:hypothetical protein
MGNLNLIREGLAHWNIGWAYNSFIDIKIYRGNLDGYEKCFRQLHMEVLLGKASAVWVAVSSGIVASQDDTSADIDYLIPRHCRVSTQVIVIS